MNIIYIPNPTNITNTVKAAFLWVSFEYCLKQCINTVNLHFYRSESKSETEAVKTTVDRITHIKKSKVDEEELVIICSAE